MNNKDSMISKDFNINRILNPVRSYFKQNIGIIFGLIAMMVIVSFMSDSFLTGSNLLNILLQISTNVLLSFGMLFVILICGIDLSVGPLLAFSGVSAAYLLS